MAGGLWFKDCVGDMRGWIDVGWIFFGHGFQPCKRDMQGCPTMISGVNQ
jgi:hypothetical protein